MPFPKIQDSRILTDEELDEKIIAVKRYLFELRLTNATGNLRKTHLIKHTKCHLAQLLTVENERKIETARVQGKSLIPRKLAKRNDTPDSKIDANLLYAFDLLNRGLEPDVRVINRKKGSPLIDMIVQLYEPSWHPADVPDYHEDFRFDNIIGCLGSLDTVHSLKKYAAVKFIEASKPAGVAESIPCEVISSPDESHKKLYSPASLINAEILHEKERGDKAIIAFIDDGIDIFHDAFYTIDPATNIPRTRVLAVWDQTDASNSVDNPSNIISPGVCSSGKEYLENDIQAYIERGMSNSLNSLPLALTNGQGGHGTMVASIAAGSQGQKFPGGVAPQAKILLVKINPQSFLNSHVKALKYIEYIAQRENLPVVVNVSQGINGAAHDGISTIENAYEAFLNDKLTTLEHCVVKSAGNERLNKLHADINILARNYLTWDSRRIQRTQDSIQLWFSSVNKFKFSVKYFDWRTQTNEKTDWITLEDQTLQKQPFIFRSGNECRIKYWKHKSDDRNTDSCIEVFINKGTNQSIMDGHWELEIRRIGKKQEGSQRREQTRAIVAS